MAYVYRYIDKADMVIKYVGVVYGENRTLKDRVREHKYNDVWCKDADWLIQYITSNINTRTDAEYFESHYISLYGTDKYYNEKKSGWGVSNYLPDREKDWIDYDETINEADIMSPENFIDLWLNYDADNRSRLYHKYIYHDDTNKRADWVFLSQINKALNKKLFNDDIDIVSIDPIHINYKIKSLGGSTSYYSLLQNKKYRQGTYAPIDLIPRMREYANKMLLLSDKLESAIMYLQEETNFFIE